MQTCPRCGSIRVRRGRARALDYLVAIVTRRHPHACGRCGWRGRMKRAAAGPENPSGEHAFAGLGSRVSAHAARKHQRSAEHQAVPGQPDLDLAALDDQVDTTIERQTLDPASEHTRKPVRRRPKESARKRSRRKQVAGGIALAAAMMFALVLMLLAKDCAGPPPDTATSRSHAPRLKPEA